MYRAARRSLLSLIVAAVWLAVPYYLDEFWVQIGTTALAYAIGAFGLVLLTGDGGQLSLAHGFFAGVGAYTYTALAASPDGPGVPTPLAALAAVATAGCLGLGFGPVAARLKGLYLGVASLGLVFLGQYLLASWTSFSGGYFGRTVPPFRLFGLTFADRSDAWLGAVPLGQTELLWLLSLPLAVVSLWLAQRIASTRLGHDLRIVRDSEIAAAGLGVSVMRTKLLAFSLAGAYAGISGVLVALTVQRVVPESFGMRTSVTFLLIIVLGGMTSMGGALVGAFLVTGLPLVLDRYAGATGLLAQPGEPGMDAVTAATVIYGATTIIILLRWPRGLAGLGASLSNVARRWTGARSRPSKAAGEPSTPSMSLTARGGPS